MAYLDYAATAPIRPSALAAVTAELARTGNPSSLHACGRRARRVVEESREAIAEALAVRPSDVIFTSGGTEADNLAVKGLFWSRSRTGSRPRKILYSRIEHHAITDPVAWLAEKEGAQPVPLPVDSTGRIEEAALRAELAASAADVVSVHVMWANNEVGTVAPIEAIAAICAEFGVPFHTDAVQALAWLDPIGALSCQPDLASITAHKAGGPVGTGALINRSRHELVPLLHGGGQERNVRSGTLDAAAVAGFAAAVTACAADRAAARHRVGQLRDELVARIQAKVPDAVLNGDPSSDPDRRVPGHAHLSFPGCEGDVLMMLLDAQGIECSTGSACSAGVPRPSEVLLAMGADPGLARGSLRFSLGWDSTQADVDAVIAVLPQAVTRARGASPADRGAREALPADVGAG